MASSARIDELRKKFDENPRRYFAPLANEYRKAGDLEQAIFICQEYLPQQPGHMSGHIVYGQALFEMGRHEEAKGVFETALSLDPENLIALKHLGDIARQAGDSDAARGWYQRVLEADPRNEEIAQLMMSLLGPNDAATLAPAADASWADQDGVSSAAATPISIPAVSAPEQEALAEVRREARSEAPSGGFDVEKSVDDAQLGAPPLADAEPPPLPSALTPVVPPATERSTNELLDLEEFSFGGAATSATPPPLPLPPQPPIELATDLKLGLPEDATPPAPTSTEPDTLLGLETFEARPAVAGSMAIDATESASTNGGNEDAGISSGFGGGLAEAAEASNEGDGAPAEAFVTETMAELYLQQGHVESALDIYQKLVEQRPGDEDLRERLRALEARVRGAPPAQVETGTAPTYAGPTIREFLTGLFARRATPARATTPEPEPRAEEQLPEVQFTEERFAEEQFQPATESNAETSPLAETSTQAEASAQPETSPLAEEGGAEPAPEPDRSRPVGEPRPTPSSSETVSGSIDALFSGTGPAISDDDATTTLSEAFAPEGPETAPLPGVPAHQASSELSLDHVFKANTPARSTPETDSEAAAFSFDQFFSEEAGQGGPATGGESSVAGGGAAQGADDIAQFNAWLNGLKKT